MEQAGLMAYGQSGLHIEKDNPAVFGGDDVADQFLIRSGSVVLSENLAFFEMSEDVAVSPVEVHDDVHAPGFDKADVRNAFPGFEDHFVFLIFLLPGVKADEKDG
jgi:hypothetical protein